MIIQKITGYRLLLLNIVLAGIYFLAKVGLLSAISENGVTHIWLPSGFTLAILLLTDSRYLLSLFLGAFVASLAVGDSIGVSAGIALGNTLEPLLGWWLLTHCVKIDIALNRLRDFLLILFFAAPLSACVSALLGVTTLVVSGRISSEQWVSNLISWWMSDTLGIILVTPFIIAWFTPLPRLRGLPTILSAFLPLVLAFLAGQIIFLDWFAASIHVGKNAYLMFLFISWTAVTLGTRGVTFILMMTTLQALSGVHHHLGYFGTDVNDSHLINLWFYILTLSVVGTTLACYITELQQTAKQLVQKEQQLRILSTAIEQSPTSVMITDLTPKLLYVNPKFTQVTGYSAEEVIRKNPRVLQSGLTPATVYQQLWETLVQGNVWQGELINRRKNGEIYWEEAHIAPVRDSLEVITHYVGVKLDITERKAAEEKIKQLAFYDPLTGLANRRKLLDRLHYAIALNHRTNSQFAVFMMDLDKFKAVNDKLGHAAGDELLKQVALRITEHLRDSDMVARLGGDEFVLVLENLKFPDDVETIALKVIADLTLPFQLSENDTVQIGASIGISLYPQHGSTPEKLMDHADTALYQAKDNGRGCFAYFSATNSTSA
jgi:diguanylate cyclase (GGDEF)-like protein/PAS domain S-box-containing protein